MNLTFTKINSAKKMSEIKNVMHVRANQPTCVCDLQLVKLLISLHIQRRTPVSNSCFHVLGTDYSVMRMKERCIHMQCKSGHFDVPDKRGTVRNGSPCYALARPVRAPCSALTPAGRCGASIGPEFTQLFFVTPHTPPHSSSADLCFARARLLFPVG